MSDDQSHGGPPVVLGPRARVSKARSMAALTKGICRKSASGVQRQRACSPRWASACAGRSITGAQGAPGAEWAGAGGGAGARRGVRRNGTLVTPCARAPRPARPFSRARGCAPSPLPPLPDRVASVCAARGDQEGMAGAAAARACTLLQRADGGRQQATQSHPLPSANRPPTPSRPKYPEQAG